jgi:hypothetical protein
MARSYLLKGGLAGVHGLARSFLSVVLLVSVSSL